MNPVLVSDLDAAVWAACPFASQWINEPQGKYKECKKCPQWEIIDGEKYQRACRGIIEEIIKPALEAYTPKEVCEQNWMPIETAPKDGTFILCSHESGMVNILHWSEHSPYKDTKWRKNTSDIELWKPTYWMPIPKARI